MIDVDQVRQHLRRWRLHGLLEEQVQTSIAAALLAGGIKADREVRLSLHDRIDFLTTQGVGIEVKLHGRAVEVLAQLERYAASDRVVALLLVSARSQLTALPDVVGGKPLRTLWIGRGIA